MVKKETGFSILELMAVVAIIGILAAIAIPTFTKYKKKTNRTNMMADLQLISSELEHLKQAKGGFKKIQSIDLEKFTTIYPNNGDGLYEVSIISDNPKVKWTNPIEENWTIIAEPIATALMNDDGNLTLNYQGIKCRRKDNISNCGSSDEWRQEFE